jgi:hypothetical protein
MPKSNESINQELYDLLDTKGFQPKTYDSSGKVVPLPDDAEIIQFNYIKDNIDHGTVTITINGMKEMQVYFNDDITHSVDRGVTKDMGDESQWTQFLKQLKKFATRRQLAFSIKNIDRLEADMKRRAASKKLEEGYYGTRRTSFSDNTPRDVKLVIKHNKTLEEGDKRYRFIEKIFVETAVGERLLCPTVKPSQGRAFARHIVEGGQYRDERWNHIAEICEDIKNLGGFVRATRTKTFNESAGKVVESARSHYGCLRETMHKLQTGRGYNSYFDNWQPMLTETEGETDFASMFSHKTVDPRIEKAIPVLNKIGIQITEMTEVQEFESWADGLINEELLPVSGGQIDDLVDLVGRDSEPMPVGADASSAIGELEGIIDNESLYNELRKAAQADPDNDARPVILGWLEKNRDNPVYDKILDKLEVPPTQQEPVQKQQSPENLPEPDKMSAPKTSRAAENPNSLAESDVLARLLKLAGHRG